MTGTVYTCLHTNQSRSFLNHIVQFTPQMAVFVNAVYYKGVSKKNAKNFLKSIDFILTSK